MNQQEALKLVSEAPHAWDETSVAELRKEASRRGLGSGTWRAGASKADLISALDTGVIPNSFIDGLERHVKKDDLAAILAGAIQGHLKQSGSVDPEQVRIICQEELAKQPARVIEVRTSTSTVTIANKQHAVFENLLKVAAARCHAYLVGPAGSGKTTCAENVAQALNLPFSCVSVGEQTTMAHLFGFIDATGTYRETEFYKRYRDGGIFLIDEIDSGNANVLTSINSALANGKCAFPVGMVTRHADFICIAAGNTYGLGASRQYVGRNPIDAATLDRFVFVEFPYDASLEASLSVNADWLFFVREVRSAVDRLGLKYIISPRAVLNGERLLAQGMDLETVKEFTVWKGMDQSTRDKIGVK